MNSNDMSALIEPYPVPDIVATGRMSEDRGETIRLTFFCDRIGVLGPERVVVARIVFARKDYMTILREVLPAALHAARGAPLADPAPTGLAH